MLNRIEKLKRELILVDVKLSNILREFSEIEKTLDEPGTRKKVAVGAGKINCGRETIPGNSFISIVKMSGE
ncbi:MAG: hypothetical protein ACOX6Z_06360 [Dethiobacteria bacterium]|jgi:methanogenic corrinoid protein MtbC1